MEPINAPVFTPAEPKQKKSKKRWIILAFIVILLAGGIYGFTRSQSGSASEDTITPTEFPTPEVTEEPTPTEELTPSPTEKPTPTEKPEVKKATDMSLQILNGSGEEGVAGAAKSHLESKGYQYFETGNADNFDYQGVTIKIKSSMDQYLSDLKSALSDKYTLASDSGTLSDDSLFDAVVIVGK